MGVNNDQRLAEAVSWLRLRLQTYIAGDQAAPASRPVPLPPTLFELSRQLGLSFFEIKILLLCVAAELAPDISGLYAQAQGNPNAPYPTFALSLALFDDASWDALSPDRPLRYWRLIRIHHTPTSR